MARLPKTTEDAVGELHLPEGGSVLLVGPAGGYVEATVESVGSGGTVRVQDPPPDLDAADAEVVEAPGDGHDAVVVWMGSVVLHELGDYASAVTDGGTLWTLVHSSSREFRAQVTEGEVKRYLLPLGWRQAGGAVRLEKDLSALRHVRR